MSENSCGPGWILNLMTGQTEAHTSLRRVVLTSDGRRRAQPSAILQSALAETGDDCACDCDCACQTGKVTDESCSRSLPPSSFSSS